MAEVQQSGPLTGANFTDQQWRNIFGGQAAVVGDRDGTAFKVTLPTSSDVAEVGSTTQDSIAVVGGYALTIPAGQTQSITIPPSTNSTLGRTDLIVALLDLAQFTTAPGPVRLRVITGVEGSASRPAYDGGPPGVEHLPLWAVTRRSGQALSQATLTDLRNRTGPHLLAAPGILLPTVVPLGTRATRDGTAYRRDVDTNGVTSWVEEISAPQVIDGTSALDSAMESWGRRDGCRLVRIGKWRCLDVVARRTQPLASNSRGALGDVGVVKVHSQDRPPAGTGMAASAYLKDISGATYMAGVHVSGSSGVIYLNSTLPNVTIGPAGPDDTIHIHATWYVA